VVPPSLNVVGLKFARPDRLCGMMTMFGGDRFRRG
jgi:hypothetical protein